jgi:hypothetical protein
VNVYIMQNILSFSLLSKNAQIKVGELTRISHMCSIGLIISIFIYY